MSGRIVAGTPASSLINCAVFAENYLPFRIVPCTLTAGGRKLYCIRLHLPFTDVRYFSILLRSLALCFLIVILSSVNYNSLRVPRAALSLASIRCDLRRLPLMPFACLLFLPRAVFCFSSIVAQSQLAVVLVAIFRALHA